MAHGARAADGLGHARARRSIASRASWRAPIVVSAKPTFIVSIASRSLSPAWLAARAAFSPRFERAGELAARLADDGERLPGVDRRRRRCRALGELEQIVGLALGRRRAAAERVARGRAWPCERASSSDRPSSRALPRTSDKRATMSEPGPRASS